MKEMHGFDCLGDVAVEGIVDSAGPNHKNFAKSHGSLYNIAVRNC